MSASEERKKYLWEKFIYAAKSFGKAGTRSDYPGVPKEQQLSIDLGNKKSFSIIGKILNWIENKLKFLFPRYNLFTEVGTEERKVIATNTKVKYFSQEEQFEHALYIDEENKDLKLYSLKGKLYDTRGKISKTRKDCVAYVITLDGKLVVHEHIDVGKSEYAYRHSTLAGGKPVICSGLMKVIDGKIAYIDNNSGHYKPKEANLYNAIKKLEGLFSQDAKVTYLGSLELLRKQIPFICRIPHTQESVEKFLKRMEKKGKDGLTKYQRHFTQVKEHNSQYRQLLFLKSYKPIPILDGDNSEVIKMKVEHSVRKIIGADYGHKPVIHKNKEDHVWVDIDFNYEDDCKRLTKILDLKGLSYIIQNNKKEGEYTVSMVKDNIEELIKNTLQINIDSVELLDQQRNKRAIES
ncbi:MAG: hypothetical protein sL5_08170 [Candidatus Mesenet longicola]|uniref:Uncharacterized protein n=1 Tax=Candidatus Mesenet longicola TaxID=1892558 RepID=A0A8J3MMD5_9RICK|nr:MAG: hypothetical protein sGL2_08660 [Candidatus Mesenet longicola]GHM59824.1 MAG: hypothetical protein sL5_08170 [Candidatus Mesenet longicola]